MGVFIVAGYRTLGYDEYVSTLVRNNRQYHYESSGIIMLTAIGVILLSALALIGGYASGIGKDNRFSQSAAPLATTNGTNHATLNLTIVTGEMLGKGALGPAYVPSNFTVPAYSTVLVTVTDFDTASPLTGALTKYAKVTGTVGNTMTVQAINPLAPNTLTGEPKTLDGIFPTLVAHTLTIPALGLNVPMAAQSRIIFTIKTGNPGSYQWECMDPCGSGSNGLGTPMWKTGYMAGTMTVA